MGTQISRGRGKLYRAGSEQPVDTIRYQVHEEVISKPIRWWGEFTFTGNVAIQESERYIIELEDGRQGWCHLRKLVNRVVRGVPPHYVYRFTGNSPLE
jgi:hypothetical protein